MLPTLGTTFLASLKYRWVQIGRYPSFRRRAWVFAPLEFVLPFLFTYAMFRPYDSAGIGTLFVGTLAWSMFHNTLWDTSSFLRVEQVRGTLELVLSSPSSTLVWVLGGAGAIALYHAVGTVAAGVLGLFLLNLRFDVNWPAALVALPLVVLVGCGSALLAASLVLNLKEMANILSVGTDVAFILSGATYSIETLPRKIAIAALFLPFAWAIRLIKVTFLVHAGLSEVAQWLLILGGMGALCTVAGAIVLRRTVASLRHTGRLTQF